MSDRSHVTDTATLAVSCAANNEAPMLSPQRLKHEALVSESDNSDFDADQLQLHGAHLLTAMLVDAVGGRHLHHHHHPHVDLDTDSSSSGSNGSGGKKKKKKKEKKKLQQKKKNKKRKRRAAIIATAPAVGQRRRGDIFMCKHGCGFTYTRKHEGKTDRSRRDAFDYHETQGCPLLPRLLCPLLCERKGKKISFGGVKALRNHYKSKCHLETMKKHNITDMEEISQPGTIPVIKPNEAVVKELSRKGLSKKRKATEKSHEKGAAQEDEKKRRKSTAERRSLTRKERQDRRERKAKRAKARMKRRLEAQLDKVPQAGINAAVAAAVVTVDADAVVPMNVDVPVSPAAAADTPIDSPAPAGAARVDVSSEVHENHPAPTTISTSDGPHADAENNSESAGQVRELFEQMYEYAIQKKSDPITSLQNC